MCMLIMMGITQTTTTLLFGDTLVGERSSRRFGKNQAALSSLVSPHFAGGTRLPESMWASDPQAGAVRELT